MLERLGSQGKFALCGIGIFVCYFYYGILQEKITRGKYGEGEAEERFTCIMALVAFQCAVNYLYALVMGRTVLKQGEDTTKSSFYACASFTYLLAMVTSNKALSWVNYPTQVTIADGCRGIIVKFTGDWQVLQANSRDGAWSSSWQKEISSSQIPLHPHDRGGGGTLHVQGLSCQKNWIQRQFDRSWRAAAVSQSHMRWSYWGCPRENEGRTWYKVWSYDACHEQVEHWLPSSGAPDHRRGRWVHIVSSAPPLCSLGARLVFSGLSFGPVFHFHDCLGLWPPPLLHHHYNQVIYSSLCQQFITMIFRKFFTVLASVIFFGNSLVLRQWVGTAFVFAGSRHSFKIIYQTKGATWHRLISGIFLDGLYGKQKKPDDAKTSKDWNLIVIALIIPNTLWFFDDDVFYSGLEMRSKLHPLKIVC